MHLVALVMARCEGADLSELFRQCWFKRSVYGGSA